MTKQLHKYFISIVVLFTIFGFAIYWPKRFHTPAYNRIEATVKHVTSNPETPNIELTVQRVAGDAITLRSRLAAGCYAISGKDFSECDGQQYSVQRDGSVEKSGPQYSNEPFVSPTGSYTIKFSSESTLKPKEEPYPGAWKTKVTITNRNGQIVQSFDSKRYGGQFIDVTPLAYSPDEQHVFLQVWAMRGGDFIDQMVIVKQAVQDKSFEIVVRNPNPAEAISDSTVKSYTLSLFLGLGLDKKSMFVEEMKPSDENYRPQLLYVYDFVAGKRERELPLNTKGGFTLLFSPNQQFFTQQVDNQVTITKVSNGKKTSVKPSIPDRCNLNDVSDDGKSIAITCDQNDLVEAWVYNVRNQNRKLITSWPMNASRHKPGQMYRIFAGFAE